MQVDDVSIERSRNPLDTILTSRNSLPADLRASLLLLVFLFPSLDGSKANNIDFLLEASLSVRERAFRDLSFGEGVVGDKKGKVEDILMSSNAQALIMALDILSEVDESSDTEKVTPLPL